MLTSKQNKRFAQLNVKFAEIVCHYRLKKVLKLKYFDIIKYQLLFFLPNPEMYLIFM
jgi:hypothetical protein